MVPTKRRSGGRRRLALQQYSYPDNVRELEHITERSAVQASGRLITAEIIPDALPATSIAAAENFAAPLSELSFHASEKRPATSNMQPTARVRERIGS
jgi:DNA-binding NtrC family response regulator